MSDPDGQAVQPLQFDYHAMPFRAITDADGSALFVTADVAQLLGYSGTGALNRSLEDDEKGVRIMHTPGGEQRMAVITEAGLYHAILNSRRPEARAFRRWVTHTVLPQIRRTGAYTADLAQASSGELLSLLHQASAAGLEQQRRAEAAEQAVRQLEPRAAVTDHLVRVADGQTVTAVAKELGLGPNKLFAFLRERGVLRGDKHHWNLPRQEHIDEGRLTIKVTPYVDGKDRERVSRCTLVTGKGLAYVQRLAAKYGLIEEPSCAT